MTTQVIVSTRETKPIPKSHPLTRQERERRKESVRKASYAAGIVAGTLVVKFVKKRLGQLPFIGGLLKPILGLVPTALVGPALGAAAVYSLENGSPLAVRDLVISTAENVTREVQVIAADVAAEAHDAIFQQRSVLYDELEKIAPAVEEAAIEVAKTARQFKKGARDDALFSGSDRKFLDWSVRTK